MTTQTMIDRAYLALPFLVHFAKMHRRVTYGQLSALIGERNPRTSTHWLGYIRDGICIPRDLPLLTAIVVNQRTELPGTDWLPEGTEGLSREEYRSKYLHYRDQVFGYSGWDLLLQDLGIPPASPEDM